MLGTTFRPIKSEPLGMETMALEFAFESQGMGKSRQESSEEGLQGWWLCIAWRTFAVSSAVFPLPHRTKCGP